MKALVAIVGALAALSAVLVVALWPGSPRRVDPDAVRRALALADAGALAPAAPLRRAEPAWIDHAGLWISEAGGPRLLRPRARGPLGISGAPGALELRYTGADGRRRRSAQRPDGAWVHAPGG